LQHISWVWCSLLSLLRSPTIGTCHMHDNLAWRRRVDYDATTCAIRQDARFIPVFTPGERPRRDLRRRHRHQPHRQRPANLTTIRAPIIAAIEDAGYLHVPEGRRDHTTPAETLRLHGFD
jgi:hypothetical protein